MESNGGLDSNDVNGDLFSARQLTMEIVDELKGIIYNPTQGGRDDRC